MTAAKPAIQINKVSKRYPGATVLAVNDLSLTVHQGEVYGFLGPNGAGKSTTIRLLLNFIQPTEGSAQILGLDSVRDSVEIKRSLGYLAGDVALYGKMTGQQFLSYMAELQPPKHSKYQHELAAMLKSDLSRPINTLSKGNRQKIGLIQAFMHEPELLILDEPTSGLDPLMQDVFFELVRTAKSRGATVFVSSHNLVEIQKMCDRAGFIRDGRMVDQKTMADWEHTASQSFDITFAGSPPLEHLKALAGAKVEPIDGQTVAVHIKGDLNPLITILAHHPVKRLVSRERDLEQEFMHLYNGGDER